MNDDKIGIKRRLENGVESVESTFPTLITVHSSAPACRARNAKRVMTYKHARTFTELQEEVRDYTELYDQRPYLSICEWNVETIEADPEHLGLSGSPTKVKKIDNVVLQQKDSMVLTDSNQDVELLMANLISGHIIG